MSELIEQRLRIISKFSKQPGSRRMGEELAKLPPKEDKWCIKPTFTSEITGLSTTNTVRAIAAGFVIEGHSAKDSIEKAKLVVSIYDLMFKDIDTLED